MSNATYLATTTMPWRDDPGIPGFKEKVLHFDPATEAVLRMWYLPPGWGTDIFDGKPDRHYHSRVVERGFHLYGDFPHWEFTGVADLEGSMEVFTTGLFMDRPVMSLHGLLPTPNSETGAVIIYWNNGPGTSVRDPKFAEETITVPFDASADVGGIEFNQARLTQTNTMAWQPHPRVAGWKIKKLAGCSGGDGRVALVHIPTDWAPAADTVLDAGPKREWLYVVSGDMRLDLVGGGSGAGAYELKEWDYLDWQSPLNLSFAARPSSDAGCVALYVGEGALAG